ncbi:MAG TPA: tetratricopeptide repeat protein, partial [Bacteroidia bacterium]|nr:tetratricopeptide repeat protein [Bacteroidia bacterium]
WFEPGNGSNYGYMSVGFDNDFTQGAINEKGLMFDGFAMPYRAIKNGKGKKVIPITEVIATIMHSFSNVREVKEHLSTINLEGMESCMLVFVDRTGEYLYVAGDELVLGNEAEQLFSNFYPHTKPEDVKLDYYQNGLKFVNSSEATLSIAYCTQVMDNLHQNNSTQYTTIYDLETTTIRIYHYHNYSNHVDINLSAELKKGKHKLIIPELFPKNTPGYRKYQRYNHIDSLIIDETEHWEEHIKGKDSTFIEESKPGVNEYIKNLADEWIEKKKDYEAAIKLYQLAIKIMPERPEPYYNIGKVYYTIPNYELALQNVRKASALAPQNVEIKELLLKIEKERLQKAK